MVKDYYEILGIARNAGVDEIKRAYKSLAKKYHPDINKEKGAEEKFKEVQHAYSVLGDEQKRRNYNQFGAEAEKFQGFEGFGGGFRAADFDFGDIFESFGFGKSFTDMFGDAFSQQGRRGPARGEDIALRLNLKFEEAAFGAKKEVEFDHVAECPNCKGSGATPGTKVQECPVCHGSGVESQTRRTPFGILSTQTMCRRCQGSGEAFSDPCPVCSGRGRVNKRRKVTINVPEGIDTGQQLRIKGQGNAGERGAGKGDLIAIIYVEPHDIFKRDGPDIFMEAPVSFSEAALGSTIEVPTLRGKASLKVPAGTQSSTIFKMAGKGIRDLQSGGYGDEFVKVIVETPGKLSKRERELFEELSKEEEVSRKRKGFFDRFKGIFE